MSAIDELTNAVVGIDYPHHEAHEGNAFVSSLVGTGKGDGDKINIYFKTPDSDKRLHMVMIGAASGAGFVRIKQDVTPSGSTAQPVYNRDRGSSMESGVLDSLGTIGRATQNITHTGGTLLEEALIPGAGKSAGGDNRSDAEFILKKNTAYVFEVESDAAGINLGLVLSWYEHEQV